MSGAAGDHDRAVAELRERLRDADVPGVERVVLFGSVARDEHRGDSDIDVLAVLADEAPDDTAERLRDIAYDVMLETETVVSVQTVRAERFEDRADHPFLRRVRAEGTPIYG